MDPLSRKVRPVKRRRRKQPLSVEVEKMYRTLGVTLMVLGVMSTGFYLYMNSLKPAKGYTLKQLQMENSELESDQRALEHQIIEAQSVITIEGSDTLEEMDTAANEDLSYTKDSNFAQTQ